MIHLDSSMEWHFGVQGLSLIGILVFSWLFFKFEELLGGLEFRNFGHWLRLHRLWSSCKLTKKLRLLVTELLVHLILREHRRELVRLVEHSQVQRGLLFGKEVLLWKGTDDRLLGSVHEIQLRGLEH